MTVTSTPLYELFFYNHSGERVMVLDGWEYLEYSQRISAPWNHQIRIKMTHLDERVTFFRDTLVRDFILEIYRYDPFTQERDLVYEGFHRTIVDQATKTGDLIFTLYGTGYTHLLLRHIVVPPANEENSEKTGTASTIMYAFVDEQLINPVDTTRVMPNLSNADDLAVGDIAAYSARYTNLLTVLERCAEQGGVDFGVSKFVTPATFLFEVRDLWGVNRTQDNHDVGVTPTVFDLFLNNMEIPILSRGSDGEVTHVYVGGEGEGVAREIREYSTADETVSPWNRIEAFVDARRETTDTGMESAGHEYLEAHRATENLSFNLRETEGTRWLRDWNLGDIITARYFTFNFTKKIREVHVVVSSGEGDDSPIEVIDAELEYV